MEINPTIAIWQGPPWPMANRLDYSVWIQHQGIVGWLLITRLWSTQSSQVSMFGSLLCSRVIMSMNSRSSCMLFPSFVHIVHNNDPLVVFLNGLVLLLTKLDEIGLDIPHGQVGSWLLWKLKLTPCNKVNTSFSWSAFSNSGCAVRLALMSPPHNAHVNLCSTESLMSMPTVKLSLVSLFGHIKNMTTAF